MSSAPASTSEFRLPTWQRPLHYGLALVPDLAAFTFEAHLRLDVELTQATSCLVLHSLELSYPTDAEGRPRCSIVAAGSVAPSHCRQVSVDEAKQRATFEFGASLAPGRYTMEVAYRGAINDKLAGFYRSKYNAADGSVRWAGCTQFEATDARRALPCVDEPAAKATFTLTLIVSPHLTAVSNMPVDTRTTTRASADEPLQISRGLTYPAGLVRYTFRASPIMSTYLLAWVLGEFDFISAVGKSGTEVRVFTPLGKSQLGQFALRTAVGALDYYNEYMQIPYPLPKMDLLAIPDFAAGAMENWGCITYRETALLIDPTSSSADRMQRVARTVCHEIAHMWSADADRCDCSKLAMKPAG